MRKRKAPNRRHSDTCTSADIGDDPRRLASVEDERANLDVACAILRTPDQGGPKPT